MTVRILLVGGGYANKGAEAMLRTVQTELGKRLGDADFLLWRPSPWEVAPASASGIQALTPPSCHNRRSSNPIARIRASSSRLLNRANLGPDLHRRHVQSEQAANTQKCLEYLDENRKLFDALVDVSGFAYGDDWGLAGYQRISALAQHCRRANKPVFFMPQAWGPFGTTEGQRAVSTLLQSENVRYFSRDNESSRCLESVLGKDNQAATPFPDIAFLFRGDPAERGVALLKKTGFAMTRPVVGIAPNMRVYERVGSRGRDNKYVVAMASLARHCMDEWEVDVLLQPNEMAVSSRQDDRTLCRLIEETVSRPKRCITVDEFLSAEAVWSLLGRLEFLFASRFHSLVFAFSQGVPATALGWSHKYEELFSLFGWKAEVAGHAAIDQGQLIAAADVVWNERAARRARLADELPDLRKRLESLFDDVANRINLGMRTPAQ